MADLPDLLADGFDELPMQAALLDGSGEIVYTNDAWRRFGEENDFKGNPDGLGTDYVAVCERDPDEDAARAAEGLRDLLAGERDVLSFEYPCHSPSERRWFTMWATGFEHEGERYVLVLHLNVTDRREAEEEAHGRAERLERVARMLSHDLRNPLSVALGYADMVAADHPDDDRLDRATSALRRMETLIEDVLVFARQGAVEEAEPVSLEAEAETAWLNVPTGAATLSVVDDAVFAADRDLLAHVFENLFRNSVEHGGDGVTVRVGTTPDGFYVEDDGPGFPSAMHGDLVADDRIDGDGEGTGLGLGIVAAIADAHGWTARATASESGGVRVEFGGVDLDPGGSESE